jgi:hypothetical protein
MKYVLACALTLALAAPAIAAEYYVYAAEPASTGNESSPVPIMPIENSPNARSRATGFSASPASAALPISVFQHAMSPLRSA